MSSQVRLLLIIAIGQLASLPVAAQHEAKKRLSPAELFQQTSPAILRVDRYHAQGGRTGFGTGFFISADGLLVTNHHVIEGGASWRAVFEDDRTLEVAGIIATNPRADLAILQVKGR